MPGYHRVAEPKYINLIRHAFGFVFYRNEQTSNIFLYRPANDLNAFHHKLINALSPIPVIGCKLTNKDSLEVVVRLEIS